MYDQEKSELRLLKTYLQTQIPTTPLPPNDILLAPNSTAIKAAIGGLDKELARLEREERLVAKFTSRNSSNSASTAADGASGVGDATDDASTNDAVDDAEYVKMTKEDAKGSEADDDVVIDDDAAMAVDVDDEKDEEEWEEAAALPSSPTEKHARREGGEEPSERGGNESNEERQQQQQRQQQLRLRSRELASSAVTRIARANVEADAPFGALGLALHAALVGLTTDKNEKDRMFRCTGVPDVDVASQLLRRSDATEAGSSGGGGGFAPPIRELPRGTLVPPAWEENAKLARSKENGDGGVICFRYKCGEEVYSVNSGRTNDATTVYLALQLSAGSDGEEQVVSVTFGTLPSTTANDNNTATNYGLKQLKFPLGKHVNLDGFAAAKRKNGGGLVSPSLFYVSLSDLLLEFHSYFGILLPAMEATREEEFALEMQMPPSVTGRETRTTTMPDIAPPTATAGAAVNPLSCANSDNNDPLRIMNSQQQQQQRGRRGDFDSDLLPGGPQPGGLHDVPPGGGSQVGPNHPVFDRTFGDNDYDGGYEDDFGGGFGNGGGSFGVPGVGGGMGMRPRFDPYGPPGGPTEPERGGRFFPGRGSRLGRGGGRGGRGRGGRGGRIPPPGGFGNPNPDHMTPPGGGYFS